MSRYRSSVTSILGISVLVCSAAAASAQVAPSLGSAQSYAVLAGSTVTNVGPSVITGDLGVSAGSAITGFPPGVVLSGTIHSADASAAAAQTSLTAAFTSLGTQACTQDLTGQDLGGLTLTPGVYCFSTSAQLTGTLTLNAQGNSAAVFIFKMGSTITTASGSSVVMINSGVPCNVYWRVGSSATLGTTTSLAGSILAQESITLNTGVTVTGRALARTGAVTLDSNAVAADTCGLLPPGCPTITFSPISLPVATIGVAYTQTFSGSGGSGPYTFLVIAGALPAELTLSAAGGLSGTPASSGEFTFTIRATDANSCFLDRPYTMTTLEAVPTLPQVFAVLLALGLTGVGYVQLRRHSSESPPYFGARTR